MSYAHREVFAMNCPLYITDAKTGEAVPVAGCYQKHSKHTFLNCSLGLWEHKRMFQFGAAHELLHHYFYVTGIYPKADPDHSSPWWAELESFILSGGKDEIIYKPMFIVVD